MFLFSLNLYFSDDKMQNPGVFNSLSSCPCLSPCRHSLWPWWSECTQTQTGRWTCTGPLSGPCRSAALAPSGCILGCQYHSPDLQREVRKAMEGGRMRKREKKLCILNGFVFTQYISEELMKRCFTNSVNGLEDHVNHHNCACSTNSSTAQIHTRHKFNMPFHQSNKTC